MGLERSKPELTDFKKKKDEPKKKKKVDLIDMLIPAPMFDPSDPDQSQKGLGLKMKKGVNGKPAAPTADQVQRAFIRK